MLRKERRKKILELLADEKTMSVERLERSIFVSEPTIRRDLMQLAKECSIKRTRGGFLIVEAPASVWQGSCWKKKDLSILTYGVNNARILAENETFHAQITCGRYMPKRTSIYG